MILLTLLNDPGNLHEPIPKSLSIIVQPVPSNSASCPWNRKPHTLCSIDFRSYNARRHLSPPVIGFCRAGAPLSAPSARTSLSNSSNLSDMVFYYFIDITEARTGRDAPSFLPPPLSSSAALPCNPSPPPLRPQHPPPPPPEPRANGRTMASRRRALLFGLHRAQAPGPIARTVTLTSASSDGPPHAR